LHVRPYQARDNELCKDASYDVSHETRVTPTPEIFYRREFDRIVLITLITVEPFRA
jgi:hypothetical protein